MKRLYPLVALALAAACTPVGFPRDDGPAPAGSDHAAPADASDAAVAVAPAWPLVPPAGDTLGSRILAAALAERARRVVISRTDRFLWVMRGDSVLYSAPVAIGRDTVFRYEGKAYDFATPRGRRVVQFKEVSPAWIPPDWHYYEIAATKGLEAVHLHAGQKVPLSDSTSIEVRGKEVGRVNRYGNFWAFTPGDEIIFDGKVFIPPLGSPQRSVPGELGTHRLAIGDAYFIHGTPRVDTIGEAASHGCVRLRNTDVEAIYGMVEKGDPVFIY